MSLTKLLENKTRAFVLGVSLTACGDTNHYHMNDGLGNSKSGNSYTVEDACESFAECEIDPHDYRTPMEKCISQLQGYAAETDDVACFATTCKVNTEDHCFIQCN